MSSTFLHTDLIAPYGGTLVDLLASPAERRELVERAGSQLSVQLPSRVLCDLELLATGGLSPLDRFMGQADYTRVLEEMRLANGTLFPVPITLPVGDARGLAPGQEITLRNAKNNLLGWMRVEDVFEVDEKAEMLSVAGTLEEHHPLLAEMRSWGRLRASGPVRIVELPRHYDFPELRRTPAQVRAVLAAMENPKVVAYQSDRPLDRALEEATRRAAEEIGAGLLLQPVVGDSLFAEIDHYTRVRMFRAVVGRYYNQRTTLLNLLPLAMRWNGSRQTLLHAILQRNFGASHLLVETDSADARLLEGYETETGVRAVSIAATARQPEQECYHPEAVEILQAAYPPRQQQGFCVWFTGLPSSGKSTVAEILASKLLERGRQVTLLDGDVVRTNLSRGLGFSSEDRDINIRRIGFVAAEITRHQGVVITAAVSPYRATRNQVRAMMHPGRFVEVFVDTPTAVCEQRDVKGFYAQARAGRIKGFTGVDDPYEPPLAPEITLQTTEQAPEENAEIIIRYLAAQGFLVENL
jgi:sulfate adenylyltransferase